MGKLTAVTVKAAKEPGKYHDGDGLFLLVQSSGSRSWVVRLQKDGKRRDYALGGLKDVSLAKAREAAALKRAQVAAGLDPFTESKKQAGIPTFKEAAEKVHALHMAAWSNGKHQNQWIRTLETYAYPTLGEVSVALVDTDMVVNVLSPIWTTKHETARRVLQRINRVVDWAVAQKYRDAGLSLSVVRLGLPRVRIKLKHHPYMAYQEVAAFFATLKQTPETFSKLLLEFQVLTASRPQEAREAVWSEFDFGEALWHIPAERMKNREPHTEILSARALDVLERAAALAGGQREGFVFPGEKPGKPLSNMTANKLLKGCEKKAVPHGFRATFQTWRENETIWSRETGERALAHTIKDKAERAYRHGTQLAKRRPMMEVWSDYVHGVPVPAKWRPPE